MNQRDRNAEHASGVQELIDRLRADGVAQGQARADALLEEARQRAERLLDQAHRQAEEAVEQARSEAARTRAAGEEAVRLAVRDAILELKTQLAQRFAEHLRRLVSQIVRDEQFLQRLILEIVHRTVPEQDVGPRNVLLPSDVVGLEELRRKPEELREGTLSHFVLSLTGEVLRQGITFQVADDDTPGIRVQLVEQDVEIDLSDKAIAELLLQHLLPRFRAIMEGIVQ